MTGAQSRTTAGRGRLYDSVLDTIGDTPCIRINQLAPDHVQLYVKAEFFNPAGSVKDRLARACVPELRESSRWYFIARHERLPRDPKPVRPG
jgi:cysteine synthase A